MDAKELGSFIANLRKEKQITQAELAKRLNVTDKAVSRWERGLGFPDISTLEPLADVLEVSLAELMKCQRLVQSEIGVKDAAAMIGSGIDIAKYQREIQRKRIAHSLILFLIGIGIIMGALYENFKVKISASTIFVSGRVSSLLILCLVIVGFIMIAGGVWNIMKIRNNR